MPYFILKRSLNRDPSPRRSSEQRILRAGLLASGSSSGRVFPFFRTVTFQRPLSPVTAAGPRRNRTVFPHRPIRAAHRNLDPIYTSPRRVSRGMWGCKFVLTYWHFMIFHSN